MPGFFFTHIFAPYAVSTSSLAGVEMGLVTGSWQKAAAFAAKSSIKVEFLACTLPDDRDAVPSWAKASSPLQYFASDAKGHNLPTIGGIWDKGAEEGAGDYLVYTNMDIGLQEDFYVRAHGLLTQAERAREEKEAKEGGEASLTRWTALEFTRVQSMRLKDGQNPKPTLEAALSWNPIGRHPGHDCFVVPRHLVPPQLRTGGLVVGMPPWGTMYHYGLQKDDRVALLFLQGTSNERYTFHTGVEGTVESWMDNQDFRLQQYSEAFRVFGPELASRAWGAKGKHSPFYYICNATTMRYPACDFCEAFYPSSLYPEFPSRRTCKGLVTDRNFYSHLPTPERTEASDLSKYIAKESKESKKEKGGFGTADNNSNKNKGKAGKGDDGAMLAKVFGRTEPCKVKCIQEKAMCNRVGTRSLVQQKLRQSGKLNKLGGSSSDNNVPMLWAFPGSRHAWARLMLEYGLGFVTGSIESDTNESALMNHPTTATNSGDSLTCDLEGNSMIAISVAPMDPSDDQASERLKTHLSPACLKLPPFTAAIALVRNPYDSIWAEFHRKWSAQRLGTGEASPGQVQRLAFTFMSDEELDRFAVFAVRMASFWETTHSDLVAFQRRMPSKLHLLRYEDLAAANSNGGAGSSGDSAAAEALGGVADFLGLDRPDKDRVHCSTVLAKRALVRDLSEQQQVSSMDQLYEGMTTCKMWSLFGATATHLGYPRPFNDMPCDSVFESASSLSQSSSNKASDSKNEVTSCGWFHWAETAAEQPLEQWVGTCIGRQRD